MNNRIVHEKAKVQAQDAVANGDYDSFEQAYDAMLRCIYKQNMTKPQAPRPDFDYSIA